MDALVTAAMNDVHSTRLEQKVADRTKNDTLIHNTAIDADVAQRKAIAAQKERDAFSIIWPSLPLEMKRTFEKIAQEYQSASEIKLSAAKVLDRQTQVASMLGMMGKRRRSRVKRNRKSSKKH